MPALFPGSKLFEIDRMPKRLWPAVEEMLQEMNTDELGAGEWLAEGEITPYYTLYRTKGYRPGYVVRSHHLDMGGDGDGGSLLYCTKCESVRAFFAGQIEECFHCGAE